MVICKAPVPGRVKTRLCPPCTPEGAAAVAAAALADTLATVVATPADRRVLALDGEDGGWRAELGGAGLDVIAQRGDGLGARLDAAFADCFAQGPGPVVIVGMDTPQLQVGHLLALADAVGTGEGDAPRADAALAPAVDGGYWAIALARPTPGAFDGVPMSVEGTREAQRRRLEALGCTVVETDLLRDVDEAADARAVAAQVPGSRFADAVTRHLPAEPAGR